MKTRIFWIDVMRGMAIIAVVICHQQGLLHESEFVQCFTLYSVSALIFLMGITKGISIKKFIDTKNNMTILKYSFNSMFPTIVAYLGASIVTDRVLYGIYDKSVILNHIINFNASAPFYFIEHYITLSLWAPVVYFIFLYIMQLDGRKSK